MTNAKFSPDGRHILTSGSVAGLWDRQGNFLAVLGDDSAMRAKFSPDGGQILAASGDNTVWLWDIKGSLLAVLRGQEELLSIPGAEFSPDGRQILTASSNTARLWDVSDAIAAQSAQMTALKTLHEGVAQNNAQVAVLGDDNVSAQSEQMTALQSFQGGVSKNNAQVAVLGDDNVSAYNAKFSPDGQQILAFSNDRTAQLWDRKGNLLAVLREHEEEVSSAEFSPDGRYILTDSSNTARLWDSQGNLLAVLRAHEDSLRIESSLPFDVQQTMTFSNDDKTARLWDGQGNLLAVLGGHEGLVRIAKFSPDGQQILTIGSDRDKTARLWDRQGNLLAVLRGHESNVISAVFSSDGRHILTTSYNEGAEVGLLWDRQGNLLAVLGGHEDGFTAKFSPDGRHILMITHNKVDPLRLLDRQGNLVAEFWADNLVNSWVESAAFSPDGRQILTTAINDKTARLWDLQGNLLAVLQGHKDSVTSAVFSPDGQQILTASADHTARLWDRQGNLLAVFWGHEKEVKSAEFSPDGRQILTSSKDSTARLWDISAGIKVSAAEVAFIKGNQLSTQGTIESRQLALQKLEEALALYRVDRNYVQAALTLLSMGKIYANFGQFQSALDSYNQGLRLSQQGGAKAEEAAILNSVGQLYTDLADEKTSLDYYNQALRLFYHLNDPGAVATTLNNIGDIRAAAGNWKNALDSYNKALVISRPAGNLAAEATALTGIGSTYIASKEWSTALNAYNQALNISRNLNDKVKETTILNQMGKVQAALGQNSTALENYNQALSLSQQLGYKTEEAHILYNLAILNRKQNNLAAAKTPIETAINIIENLRTQIASQELRQSYFARNQDYYQFYIDLLMQLHQKNPDQGYDAQAFHASERARARSLLELLSEASANIRQGVDPQLLAQEQNLQQQLSDFQTRKYQIVSAQSPQEAVKEIQQKIDTVLKELAQTEAKIRASSPRYAALKYPEPLNLQQIQQQVIDDNTLLLEYSLGEERSYLWAVTKTSFTSYELPSRTEIEATAKNFRDTLTKETTRTSPQMVAESAALISQMILAPVASELGNKRLLIVADGALQYIPFGALSLEKSEAPLIVKHEIVNLPSASTLAILRRDMATRQPAPKTIALFADPVFSTDDERLKGTSTSPVTRNQTVENLPLEAQQLQRSASEAEIYWTRLPFSRTEAEQILALVPDDLEKQAFDFTANRTTATNPDLSQYRIVHFATHGFANSKHPELSGLVLSLVDEKGTLQNGYLRLNDIFNLNLPAELVVLSACQTGLGKEIKGEGLVGLTRGFMYAGAPRVVVSLWSVDDQVTSELMTRFYKKMLQDKLPPAAALRSAQIEVLQLPKWQSPYYWAAFGLQGEWN
ncbi:CHAT domain-containing protein [Microcoleus sp. MON2_D5]|uniref:CHAT domain-containing protein n=1 Tax=Microcoleus sp. MON2_D5 TaxID=2818833 RepID=UPI002FD34B29